jgi:hypothetical protein
LLGLWLFGLKWKGPAFGRALLFALFFYSTKLDITNMPTIFNFYALMGLGLWGFGVGWGLDKDFVGEIEGLKL